MSLSDARNKMSKSDPNEASRISLLDQPDVIKKKIKRAKTDAQLGLEFGNPERPEADNLLSIYSILSKVGRDNAAKECAEMGWGKFKPLLTDVVIENLLPIQVKYKELMEDKKEVNQILQEGKERAQEVSNKTLNRVKEVLGFIKEGY